MRLLRYTIVTVLLIGAALGWAAPSSGGHADPLLSMHAISSSGPTLFPLGYGSLADDSSRAESPLEKAAKILDAVQKRDGDPLPGYVGGKTFHNRERKLPFGHYREYDVHPKVSGRNRGAERVVIEQQTGKAYYTGDHYRSFVPLN
jgi:guanyl-specific ribonuclease Sa